jgi:hypothetical protein
MSSSMMNAPCERCGATPATPYRFHYGKSAGMTDFRSTPFSTTTSSGVQSSWTEHYQIGGVSTAYLCDRCLTRAKAKRAARVLFREVGGFPLLWLFYALPVLWLGNTVWNAEWGRAALWLLAVVGIPAVLYGLIFVFLPDEDTGQRAAVDLHEKELREEGWGLHWTDKEFAKLSPEHHLI